MQHITKQGHHFANKGLYRQGYDFSSSQVQIWELDHKEGWVPKNWCSQIVVLEKTLRLLWKERRSNQSILKEINHEYSLEGQMLKLKLQYFDYVIWKADWLAKTLILGKIEGKRKRKWQGIRWLDSITDSMGMNLSKLREVEVGREAWHGAVHGFAKSWMWLNDWTTIIFTTFRRILCTYTLTE